MNWTLVSLLLIFQLTTAYAAINLLDSALEFNFIVTNGLIFV